MTDPDKTWDLWVQPWIQAVLEDGTVELLSVHDVFLRAPEIREIVGDIPTQAFAIQRLLLAILHAAVDGPQDRLHWEDLWNDGPPMDQVTVYEELWRGRFDLFSESTPFFQVAGLHTSKDEFSGLEKLVADVPAGHPFFTTRIGAGLDRLTFAEAARWLVHLQAYDISGIKSGAVGDPRVKGGKGYPLGTGWAGAIGGVLVEGDNLWQTLLLNLIPRGEAMLATFGAADRPAWEASPSTVAEADDLASRPYGPLDLYTWQSRRVRLRRDGDAVTGIVVANGDKITPQNRQRLEPMTSWRRSVPQQKALKQPIVYMPRQHDPSRALWRGLAQVLPAVAPRGKADEGQDNVTAGVFEWAVIAQGRTARVRLHAFGMKYGTQNAIVDDVFDDRLTFSVALLAHSDEGLPRLVVDAVEATDQGVAALRNLASNLVRAAGGSDDALADSARRAAAERAYSALDGPFRSWLQALEPGADLVSARYVWNAEARRIVKRLGRELVEGAGPAAWIGREVRGRRVTTPEADGWFQTALREALPDVQRPEETHS